MSKSTKDLILKLIQQDLKHNQLTTGLRNLGLDDSGLHCLDILSIVARLMEIPEGEIQDSWGTVYTNFMNESYKHKVSDRGEELKPLAEECYGKLISFTEMKN